MLQVEELQKCFGETHAVDGVSFTVKRGEAFGLLGPNGAGKTTLLSMLVGLLKPDAGTARFEEGAPTYTPDSRQRIGIAPQSLSLYDELTSQENLRFFGQLYGLRGSALQERVDWALEFAGLEDRRRHRVKTLSGGMQRRLNLAAALVHSPELVLLDEPTVGVDPQSRNHLLDAIEQLKSAGLTVLYTTHYMAEAQRLCDRVAIMDHGKLLAVDSVPRLLQSHGDASVIEAELTRKPPADMQLPGEVQELTLRFESREPLAAVGQLTNQGIEFTSLQLKQPDLESVFLALTGRHLRD